MDHVSTRRIARNTLVAGFAIALAACVPEPANRATPSQAEVSPTPSPIPTPAGPTPTPTFVRPTPTPQPSFLVYVVHSGDSLEKIAKRYGTSVRSIAYWSRARYPSLDPDSGAYRPNFLGVGWMLLLIPNAEVDPENLPPASATPGPATREPPEPPAP
jgi:LysM domain